MPNHFGDGGGAPHLVVPDRRRHRDSPRQNDEGIGAGSRRRNHPAKDDARIVQAESDFASNSDHASNVGVARILLVHELLFLLFAHVRGKSRLTPELVVLRLRPGSVFLIALALLGLRRFVTHEHLLARRDQFSRGRPMFRLRESLEERMLRSRLRSVGRDTRTRRFSASRARSEKSSDPFRRPSRPTKQFAESPYSGTTCRANAASRRSLRI